MRHFTPRIDCQPLRRQTSRWLTACALLLLASASTVSLASAAADGILQMALRPGHQAQIYPADYVLQHWVEREGEQAWLAIPGYGRVELLLPAEAGGGAAADGFYPHEARDAYDALLALSQPALLGDLSIYCLPYPRAGLTTSSTAGGRIFLSPGINAIPAAVTHMVTTHELGHAFHNRCLPASDALAWRTYRQLRGLGDLTVYSDSAPHRNRPREILAEDFRYLFGGELANYSHSIENAQLPLPDQVPGLRGFLLSLGRRPLPVAAKLAARNFPNPFNPQTRLALDAGPELLGATLSVQVYDASGRRVRDLHHGRLESLRQELFWDGRNDRGEAQPSGAYFARIQVGAQRLNHKMLLIG